MARGSKPPSRKRGRGDDARGKRKGCMFCKNKIDEVDYKSFLTLRLFMSDKGKIRSRRTSGMCRRHQNQASTAIKRAREVALLPYTGS